MLLTQKKTIQVIDPRSGLTQNVVLFSIDGKTWASRPMDLLRWRFINRFVISDCAAQLEFIPIYGMH